MKIIQKSVLLAILTGSSFLMQAQSIVFDTGATFTKTATYTRSDIESELAKYPSDIVVKNLNKIVIIDMYACGLADGFDKLIKLDSDCQCDFRSTIHHEFSSILLRQSHQGNELQKAFIALNGEYSYTYSNSSTEAWTKIEKGTKLANYFYDRKYAMRNFENDFNVIAEALFTNGHDVVQLLNEQPNLPISKKIKLVIELYQSFSDKFTLSYFDKQKI